jgi:hypothetical protein
MLFLHKSAILTVKRAEFIKDKMLHVTRRGHWCDIVNVHAPTEELQHVFDQFPKYHTEILLGDFIAKVGREDIFKPTIKNKHLCEINNDNGVRVVNFVH